MWSCVLTSGPIEGISKAVVSKCGPSLKESRHHKGLPFRGRCGRRDTHVVRPCKDRTNGCVDGQEMPKGPETRIRYSGSAEPVSVGQGLIEIEIGDRLRVRGIESGGLIERELALGWGAGGTQGRGSAGKIEVSENGADGYGIAHESDDAYRFPARRAHEREHLVDAGEEGGPARGGAAA